MSEYQAGMPDDDVRDVIRDVMAKQSLADRIEIHLSELLCAASANEDTLREPVAALVRMIDERIDERARAVVERAEPEFSHTYVDDVAYIRIRMCVPRDQTSEQAPSRGAEVDHRPSAPTVAGLADGKSDGNAADSMRDKPVETGAISSSLSRTVGREVGAGVVGNREPPSCSRGLGPVSGAGLCTDPDCPVHGSRSVRRRVAAQRGEPSPVFGPPVVVGKDAATAQNAQPCSPAPQRGTATGALSKHCNDGRHGCYQRTRGECSCGCGRCLNERATPAIDHITMSGQMSEQDDEATQIARTCCADIHQDRCAAAIRALVASTQFAELTSLVDVFEGSEQKSTVAEVLDYARAVVAAGRRLDPAAATLRPSSPPANPDEAWLIAAAQCSRPYNVARCAEDIRALVARNRAEVWRSAIAACLTVESRLTANQSWVVRECIGWISESSKGDAEEKR